MEDIDRLKLAAQKAIDRRCDWLIAAAQTVQSMPELGFREVKTSRFVQKMLDELQVNYESGIARTGVKGLLRGNRSGPCIGILSEMDGIKLPGHSHSNPHTGAAHACGHNCQIAMMLGVAVGLLAPEVLDSLSGAIALMAVPAEEFIDIEYRWNLYQGGQIGLMGGKQEFIRVGAFDDVDIAMMVHTSSTTGESKFSVGGTSNGHLAKYVRFIGKSSHSGGAPHQGVNALQSAVVALNAINAQRETFRDQDTVRLHGILTDGGLSANSTPADVRYEGRVRGKNSQVIQDASLKMDRCLRAGALSLGSKVNIVTIPGYFPIINHECLSGLFLENAGRLVGKENVISRSVNDRNGGSTDMGDLSQIMPVIHPYTTGATGLGHGVNYLINDYQQSVINPAKAMAMCVIDLLAGEASKAKNILSSSRAELTRSQYLDIQNAKINDELYDGVDL